jgi:hypothetical protein
LRNGGTRNHARLIYGDDRALLDPDQKFRSLSALSQGSLESP